MSPTERRYALRNGGFHFGCSTSSPTSRYLLNELLHSLEGFDLAGIAFIGRTQFVRLITRGGQLPLQGGDLDHVVGDQPV